MKKLYLISYYFAPLGRADGVNRAYLVKYLSQMDWDIEVISCENPHAFMRNFQSDPTLMGVIPDSVKLHRITSMYWGPLGELAHLLGLAEDPFGNWVNPVLKASDAIFREPGVIYAVVPPVTNAKIAERISQARHMPLVIDFRDNVFDLPKEIVREARTIIASTQRSLTEMRRNYNLDANKGIVVHNGYPEEHLQGSIPRQFPKERLRIVYAGLLNLDQDPAMLARAVRFMERMYPQTKGVVSADFYGPKNYYTRLFLRKVLSTNIRFRGYLPFQSALEEIARADLAYSSLRTPNKAYCIPSKVFQYIAMETPILAAGPEGALGDLITEHGIGRFSRSDDIESQAEDIFHFIRNPIARMEVKENIRRIKLRFAMHCEVEKLSKHLESVAGVGRQIATRSHSED